MDDSSLKNYVYIFTRQDISPEQQIVQSAHATYLLGHRQHSASKSTEDPCYYGQRHMSNPSVTHFTLIGVSNLVGLQAVIQILDTFELAYEVFYEEDLNNEPTSIAVYPIREDCRGPLMAFNLLRVK